jgi:Flp pilus assembly pilin Flp
VVAAERPRERLAAGRQSAAGGRFTRVGDTGPAVRDDDDLERTAGGIAVAVQRERFISLSCGVDRLRVEFTSTKSSRCIARHGAPQAAKGGESMSFKDLLHYLRARFAVEEGQTMAEYGVVLAVIAVAVVVALGLLSTSISGAFDAVRSKL